MQHFVIGFVVGIDEADVVGVAEAWIPKYIGSATRVTSNLKALLRVRHVVVHLAGDEVIAIHAGDAGNDLSHVIHERRVDGNPTASDYLAAVTEVLAKLPDDVWGILVAVAKERAKVEVLRRVIHRAADGHVLHRGPEIDTPRDRLEQNH